MNIVVLASGDGWHAADLRRAAGGRHELRLASFDRLSSHLEGSSHVVKCGDVDLTAADAALVRNMPPGSLEQIVFRMDALAQCERAGVAVINPAKSIECAVDKYLATSRLQAAGLPVPATAVCQSAADASVAFERLGGDVVVKPLFGGEGRGIIRVDDAAIAWRAFTALERIGSAIYLQRFIPHEGRDWRLLVIGEEVLGIARVNAMDWRTNISRGASAEPLPVTAELADLARRAAGAVGALVAGVDLLPGQDGDLYVLEVNAVPGWRATAGTLGVDVAARVLDLAASRCHSNRGQD